MALVSVPSHGRHVGIIIIIIISAKGKYQVRVASYDTNFTKIQVLRSVLALTHIKGKGIGKFHSRTLHEGPEGE